MSAVPQSIVERYSLTSSVLDPSLLSGSLCEARDQPFHFLVAKEQLPLAFASQLVGDFPKYAGAGFFPYDAADCGPSINALVASLQSPEFADAIGMQLGLKNLSSFPTLITLCRSLNKRHGTVHTDSRSKVVTTLVYLNRSWDHGSAGCLRFLRDPNNIESTIGDEVLPVYGTIAAFRRSDDSFHGHLPFEGERLVIQVAWIVNRDELERKARRGRLSRFVKKLAGAIDRQWGAARKPGATHLD